MNEKGFCKAKYTIIQTEKQPREWEKIFSYYTTERRLESKIYKEIKTLAIKEIIHLKIELVYKQRILNRGNSNS